MWILVSFNQQQLPENRVTTNPEYTNTQQGLPDYWYILSRLLICRAFWLCSSFAEKPLLMGPYFHYLAQIELTATTRLA